MRFATADKLAWPDALVIAVPIANPLKVALAPAAGAVNVTTAPETGLLPESLTVATRAAANAVLMVVVCVIPLVAVMVAGVPAVFDKEKLAVAVTPETEAVTVYDPAVEFAVPVTVATPVAPVTTVAVAEPPKVALAPEDGAVKVTVAPDTGFPKESFTVAARGVEKDALMVELCEVPPVAAIEKGLPALFVSGKLAGPLESGAVAEMLKAPAVLPAVKDVDIACPFVPVTAVVDAWLANVAVAPEPGAAKVTVRAGTGLLNESSTVATSGLVYAVFTVVL